MVGVGVNVDQHSNICIKYVFAKVVNFAYILNVCCFAIIYLSITCALLVANKARFFIENLYLCAPILE